MFNHLIKINSNHQDSRSIPQPLKPEPTKPAQPAAAAQPTQPKAVEPKPVQPVILDPANPRLDLDNSTQLSPWKFGAKRILSSVNSVCQRLSNLILKVVAKVFPWNRRAKRRLAAKAGADPEAVDDEL